MPGPWHSRCRAGQGGPVLQCRCDSAEPPTPVRTWRLLRDKKRFAASSARSWCRSLGSACSRSGGKLRGVGTGPWRHGRQLRRSRAVPSPVRAACRPPAVARSFTHWLAFLLASSEALRLSPITEWGNVSPPVTPVSPVSGEWGNVSPPVTPVSPVSGSPGGSAQRPASCLLAQVARVHVCSLVSPSR